MEKYSDDADIMSEIKYILPTKIASERAVAQERSKNDPELKEMSARLTVNTSRWSLEHNSDGSPKDQPKHSPSRNSSFAVNQEVARRFGQEQVETNKEFGVK